MYMTVVNESEPTQIKLVSNRKKYRCHVKGCKNKRDEDIFITNNKKFICLYCTEIGFLQKRSFLKYSYHFNPTRLQCNFPLILGSSFATIITYDNQQKRSNFIKQISNIKCMNCNYSERPTHFSVPQYACYGSTFVFVKNKKNQKSTILCKRCYKQKQPNLMVIKLIVVVYRKMYFRRCLRLNWLDYLE